MNSLRAFLKAACSFQLGDFGPSGQPPGRRHGGVPSRLASTCPRNSPFGGSPHHRGQREMETNYHHGINSEDHVDSGRFPFIYSLWNLILIIFEEIWTQNWKNNISGNHSWRFRTNSTWYSIWIFIPSS